MIDLKARLDAFERELILQALEGANGHQRRAARTLGILPTTLHEKMKRLGIPTARSVQSAAELAASLSSAAAL
jgi:DNA-binding NtrC family response regulator